MKNKNEIDTKIKLQLRKLFLQSKLRNEKINLQKISRGNYECEHCKNIFKRKELQVHHKIEINKSQDWNEYIKLLFCSIEDLEVLCKDCHKKHHNLGEIKFLNKTLPPFKPEEKIIIKTL